MYINHNQRIERHTLVLRQLGPHQFDSPIQLLVELLEVAADRVVADVLLHLGCPVDLAAVQHALTGVLHYPFLARGLCVL
jgi:hypothetical protein